MNPRPFKCAHASPLLCGILIVLSACAAPTAQAPASAAQPTAAPAPVQPTAAQSAAASSVTLTFWTPVLSGDEQGSVAAHLKDFEEGTGDKVEQANSPSNDYYPRLATALAANAGPDIAALPVPVPQSIVDSLGDAQLHPWVLCNSRLGIIKGSKYPDQAAKLMEYLTRSACGGGLPVVSVPYASVPPPEVIGQAELVPADPAVLNAVAALSDQLVKANTTINIARAVVYKDTVTGEITYMAPVGPPLTQVATGEQTGQQSYYRERAMQEGIPMAIIVVPSGAKDVGLNPGEYILREFLSVTDGSDQWTVKFIDTTGEPKGLEVAASTEPASDPIVAILADLPSAGMHQGTTTCVSCHRLFWIMGPWVCQSCPC